MTTPPFYLGAVFLKKGYEKDSMGLLVDRGAPYDIEVKDGVLLAFWRKGLPRPRNPQTLVKALAGTEKSL